MAEPHPTPASPAADPPTPVRPRRQLGVSTSGRNRRIVAGLSLILVVSSVGLWWYFSGRESTDDARIKAPIHPVAPRVSGLVLEVHVGDNQSVEKGALLVEIDPADHQVALTQARADLEEALAKARAAETGVPLVTTTTGSALTSARASVEDAEAGVRFAERDVAASRARLEITRSRLREAEAEHQRVRQDLKRYEPLIARDEISRQEFESAVEVEHAQSAAADAATFAVVVAENEVAMSESREAQARSLLRRSQADAEAAAMAPQRVAITEAEAVSANAAVDRARAALRRAELDLEYTKILAPVDGVVARKSVESGEYLRPGQAVLAVVEIDNVWAVANFKETQLEHMRPGQPAKIKVDAYPGHSFSGRVGSIGAATRSSFSLLPPENATGNFVKVVQRLPVEIIFDDTSDATRPLRAGMSVVVTVSTRP